jgi:F-type H+-transporting ATPase subunit gamma
VKREPALRRRLHALRSLDQAIGGMKSLAAHQLRVARAQLAPAREYRAGLERALAGLAFAAERPGPVALLLVASDLGLCGPYNSRLVEAAVARRRELGDVPVHCVGRRGALLLARAGVAPGRTYAARAGAAGLGPLLLRVVEDLLDDHLGGRAARVELVSARFGGVGQFEPARTVILPIRPPPQAPGPPASPYVSPARLAVVGLRELLYVDLYERMLDALASEHGARLVATGSASDWLRDRIAAATRQLRNLRLEAATQELLEIASGGRR